MPVFTLYTLPESDITVSGGGQLSGITQGDGSHLVGLDITLNSGAWVTVDVDDADSDFEDNDGGQTLDSTITYDGTSYLAGTTVEAEFTITVEDPDGNTYEIIALNFVEGGGPSYGTIEGLAFIGPVGGFPPQGVPLTVTGAVEGPGTGTTPYATYATPPCFTTGTLIETAQGPRAIETLCVGDLVRTMDHGLAPIRWIGKTDIPAAQMQIQPDLCPVLVRAGALGDNAPSHDLRISPQHRLLISDWRAEMYFGEPEVLAPAKHLLNDHSILQDHGTDDIAYFHLLFDDHQIIFSNGIPSESFLPGPEVCNGLARDVQDEILRIFPELGSDWGSMWAARPCVRGAMAQTLSPQ